MQWTSHFFEVVIVASCNEYLSLPTKGGKKQLRVLPGYDMQAPHLYFTGIYHAISAKIRHWAARGLSFLGRVQVAKFASARSAAHLQEASAGTQATGPSAASNFSSS